MTPRSDRGFTLAEVLVAAAVMLGVLGAAFALLRGAQLTFQVQPEAADMQQRLRVSVETLAAHLRMAGAGFYEDGAAGALYYRTAPIAPYRMGARRSDAGAGVFYRPDTVTMRYVPASWSRLEAGDGRPVMHTYFLRTSAGVPQLAHYDGGEGEFPVLDHVVALEFDYYADPRPPRLRVDAPLHEGRGPWTTYGPAPPAAETSSPPGEWGPGENCVFRLVDGRHTPRLPSLGPGDALVRLDPALLTDGPWCADPFAPDPFDADLLRIRRVQVRVRVEAAPASLRGPAGPLFTRGGTAGASLRLPDLEVRLDITPRNMNLGRPMGEGW